MMPGDEARLFLALWPGPEVRAAITQYQNMWRWPRKTVRVRPEKLHLTLHFIGDVERNRLPELQQQLRVNIEPFRLQLDYSELWPHGIAVMRPRVIPAGIGQLQIALGHALQHLDLPVDAREFHPHVTLARRASEALLPEQQVLIDWDVDSYVLVESKFDAGRTYSVLARY
ncbi:MAG: RNA 2',3'-cyclic phosphodiesterase [Georgfuchsia sp.]